MIIRIFALMGSGIAAYIVFHVVGTVTGSLQAAVFAAGVCAFSCGVAAARDGI